VYRSYIQIQYNGLPYAGSQEQRGTEMSTIQGELWKALHFLKLSKYVTRIHMASRTDAGVHAYSQIAEIDTTPEFLGRAPSLMKALNAYLPSTIRVTASSESHMLSGSKLPHLQRDAVSKWYRYTWVIGNHHNPLDPVNSTLSSVDFYRPGLNERLQALLGKYDFSVFESPKNPPRNPMCHLQYLHIWKQSGSKIHLDVVADRFLYKMVRNMAAYVQSLGKREMAFPLLSGETLQGYSREALPRTAPPQGLTLMAILFQNEHLQFDDWRNKCLRLALHKEFSHVENIFSQA